MNDWWEWEMSWEGNYLYLGRDTYTRTADLISLCNYSGNCYNMGSNVAEARKESLYMPGTSLLLSNDY